MFIFNMFCFIEEDIREEWKSLEKNDLNGFSDEEIFVRVVNMYELMNCFGFNIGMWLCDVCEILKSFLIFE